MKIKPPRIKKISNKKKWFIGLAITCVMVSSALALWKGEDPNTNYKYGIYEFIKTERGWVTLFDGNYINFDYGPKELENLTILIEPSVGNKVYLAYDPLDKDTNMNYVLQRLYETMTLLKIRPILACYQEKNCPDIPVVGCNGESTVFKIIKSNETNIYKEDNCLVIQGDISELNRAANKLSLILLGIIKNE